MRSAKVGAGGMRRPDPLRGPAAALCAALGIVLSGCGAQGPPPPPEESIQVPGQGTVVIDVEAPRSVAGPVLKLFESQSGIKVEARYLDAGREDVLSTVKGDVEAGRVDLFWGTSPLPAIALARAGLAVPFRPLGARPVPSQYRDRGFRWIGFGVDPRVIIYNNERVERERAPTSILDLARPPWGGKAALARIDRGSAAFHAAALFALWGPERARAFFESVRTNGNRVVEDDGAVRRAVAAGEALWGLIDLDQAIGAKREADPIHIFFPDRMSQGAVVTPHVAVLLAGAPHRDQARGLFAYLFDTEAAWQLGMNDRALITLIPNVPKPDWVPALGAFNVTQLDNDAVADAFRANLPYFLSWGPSASPGPPTAR